MSDPTATKRLIAEARAACTKFEEAARLILAYTATGKAGEMVLVPVESFEKLAHGLAHQGGRLDMAASMAHTRRARPKKK